MVSATRHGLSVQREAVDLSLRLLRNVRVREGDKSLPAHAQVSVCDNIQDVSIGLEQCFQSLLHDYNVQT